MKYSEAKQGRIFVIRLEDGEIVHEELERFAKDHNIRAANFIILGGADGGSMLIVGPEDGRSESIAPMTRVLQNVHEVAGVGTIFPNSKGFPVVHCHFACGRQNSTMTGCIREGVQVWQVMEIVLYELLDSSGTRILDEKTGLELLQP